MIIILDFDGTIIPSSKTEILCRKFLRKVGINSPPRILLVISEIVDFLRFILFKKTKKIVVNKYLAQIIDDEKFTIGILTDRSRCSLCLYLKNLGIDKEKLAFIQARRSIFDFYPCKLKRRILTSPKIKPDKRVYAKLILFADGLGVNIKEIFVVDDLVTARNTASKMGFLTAHPDDHQVLPP